MPIRACASGSRSGLGARSALPWVQQPVGTCPKSLRDGFARDCPHRHPVAPILALRDRSGAARSFALDFQAISALAERAPGIETCLGARWRPVSGRASREPVSVVRVWAVPSGAVVFVEWPICVRELASRLSWEIPGSKLLIDGIDSSLPAFDLPSSPENLPSMRTAVRHLPGVRPGARVLYAALPNPGAPSVGRGPPRPGIGGVLKAASITATISAPIAPDSA